MIGAGENALRVPADGEDVLVQAVEELLEWAQVVTSRSRFGWSALG